MNYELTLINTDEKVPETEIVCSSILSHTLCSMKLSVQYEI